MISGQLLKKRCVRELVGTYVIQPRLDAIAQEYYLKKNLKLFRKKVLYIKGRNDGTNLHSSEIKAFEYLGQNLLRKVLTGLKIYTQTQLIK